jgi:hypothetical protein
MAYQSNRLKFALLVSLGASRALRRMWFWACWTLMALCALMLFILAPHETGPHSNAVQILMFFCMFGIGAGVTGLGMWLIAWIISFFGHQIKDDYRNDRLFD